MDQKFRIHSTVTELNSIPTTPLLKVFTILDDHKVEGGMNICTNDIIKDINAVAMMPVEEKKN